MARSVEHEADRIALIRSLDLLALANNPELDRITGLAAFAFEVPIAMISLVDQFEQHFISTVGTNVTSTGREASVCAHAIEQDGVFEVPDLSLDPRFLHFPMVAEAPSLRFYAGAPLVLSSGYAVGTLCLIDYKPRTLSPDEREKLLSFAHLTASQIALLRSIGRRDPITGLPNRQQLTWDLKERRRVNSEIDLYFCIVNLLDPASAHRLGQAVGVNPVESIIRQLGYRLADELNGVSKLYHIDTASFAFLVENTSRDGLDQLLTLLRETLAEPVSTSALALQGSFHCGIVPVQAKDTADVLRKGITAMQAAQESGGDWCYYDPVRDTRMQRRYRLAAEVEAGLQRNEFRLAYQPRLCLPNAKIVSAEALLRWTHPELGEIGPNEFIPVIESTMLMPVVTQWVMRQVMAQMKIWDRTSLKLDVSVNLSAADFNSGALVGNLQALLIEFALDPARIELEVTESEWLRGKSGVVEQLDALRALGFSIAIDDFGSGYSNFSYLNELPVTTIKIDRSLIVDIEHSDRRARLVRMLVMLANELGYRTVAEGVETQAQLELLKTWDCTEAQGFLIARPQAPAALMEMLETCDA